eukprot:PRCOL_00007095-RA
MVGWDERARHPHQHGNTPSEAGEPVDARARAAPAGGGAEGPQWFVCQRCQTTLRVEGDGSEEEGTGTGTGTAPALRRFAPLQNVAPALHASLALSAHERAAAGASANGAGDAHALASVSGLAPTMAGSRMLGFEMDGSAFFGEAGGAGGASQQGGGAAAAAATAAAAEAAAAALRSRGGEAVARQLETLQRVFELAADGSGVEQPLCLECADMMCEEIGRQVEEAELAADEYEAALARMRADAAVADASGQAEALAAAEEEELAGLERRAAAAEAQAAEATDELASARRHEARVAALEEGYWREFHSFQEELRAHEDERDATLAALQWTQEQLASLRGANVLNDAFHIWHRGKFGTICGFRLGRLSGSGVEWDEINAAWGQAVLCLHTMATAVGLAFHSAKLLPMGSYPKVADSRGRHELYGPVNAVFNSGGYNKAQSLFLFCLNEFAAHARTITPDFQLPYAIEGEKVGGTPIRLTAMRDERWTQALKFTLTNLKVCQLWVIEQQAGAQGTSAPVHE